MVITFSVILFGMLLLIRPLQKNGFFMLNAALIILSAWYVETHWFRTTPFAPKNLLLFLVFNFIFINISTFLAYWADKRAAIEKKWRISEKELHALELLGGWSGALLAQKIFRHKTNKKEYQIMFWAMPAFQLAVIFFILKFLKII